MRTPSHRRRSLAALLLAAWTAVVSVGGVVSHAHAEEPRRPDVGTGWAPHRGPGAAPDRSGGSPHRHLILFGLELPGEPVPDREACGGVLPAECAGVPDHGAPVSDEGRYLPEVAPTVLPRPTTPDSAPAALPPPGPAVRVSQFARRAVSGVLRP